MRLFGAKYLKISIIASFLSDFVAFFFISSKIANKIANLGGGGHSSSNNFCQSYLTQVLDLLKFHLKYFNKNYNLDFSKFRIIQIRLTIQRLKRACFLYFRILRRNFNDCVLNLIHAAKKRIKTSFSYFQIEKHCSDLKSFSFSFRSSSSGVILIVIVCLIPIIILCIRYAIERLDLEHTTTTSTSPSVSKSSTYTPLCAMWRAIDKGTDPKNRTTAFDKVTEPSKGEFYLETAPIYVDPHPEKNWIAVPNSSGYSEERSEKNLEE